MGKKQQWRFRLPVKRVILLYRSPIPQGSLWGLPRWWGEIGRTQNNEVRVREGTKWMGLSHKRVRRQKENLWRQIIIRKGDTKWQKPRDNSSNDSENEILRVRMMGMTMTTREREDQEQQREPEGNLNNAAKTSRDKGGWEGEGERETLLEFVIGELSTTGIYREIEALRNVEAEKKKPIS